MKIPQPPIDLETNLSNITRDSRQADKLALEIHNSVPYQGTGRMVELERAMGLIGKPMSLELKPLFSPVIRFATLQRITKLLEAFDQSIASCESLDLDHSFLENVRGETPLLLSYSIPSTLSILWLCARYSLNLRDNSYFFFEMLANSLHYYKHYDCGLDVFTLLYDNAKSSNDQRLLAHALRGRGDCLYKQGKLGDASFHYNLALQLYSEIGKFDSIARVRRNLGDVYRGLGEYDKAENEYRNAFQLASESANQWELAKISQEWGWMHLMEAMFAKAKELFRNALKIYKALDRQRGKLSCLVGIRLADNRLPPVESKIDMFPDLELVCGLIGHNPLSEKTILLRR